VKAIRVGSIGVTLKVQLLKANGSPLDVSGADSVTFRLKKPGDTVVTKTGTNVNDGSDGYVKWSSTSADDFDEEGLWKLQVRATKSGSYDYYSEHARFPVAPILA